MGLILWHDWSIILEGILYKEIRKGRSIREWVYDRRDFLEECLLTQEGSIRGDPI